jgi:putative hydrolase of the HAD superfamily
LVSDVRAIYFDLDDTLCGYWDASKAGLYETFTKHGPDGFTPVEMIRHWATAFREFAPRLKQTDWYAGYLKDAEPSRTEQMRRTLERIGKTDPELASRLSQTYMEERNRALKLFPDALAVLNKLRGKYPLGLITNGPADVQRQEIDTLKIEQFFQNIYIEGEMGEGKPLKAVFDRAAATVGCRPSEMLMVGNSYHHDVRPALEYGWHAIWIRRASDVPPSAGEAGSSPEQKPPGAPDPDATIGELTELLPFLGIQ